MNSDACFPWPWSACIIRIELTGSVPTFWSSSEWYIRFAQLIDVVVVHSPCRSDDRNVDRLNHHVPLRDPDFGAAGSNVGELIDVRRAAALVVLRLRRELCWVEPDDARETRALAIVLRE